MIKESELKTKLLDMLRFLNFDTQHRKVDESSENDSNELMEMQAERRKNQHLLESLYESLIAGDITDIEYRDMKVAFTSKIAELVDREKALRQTERERNKKTKLLSKASDSLRAVQAGYELTAEISESIIEKIRVFDDRSLQVKFTFMDNEIPSREGAVYE